MKFVFSKLFYLLLALGLGLLLLAWGHSWLRWVTLAYDVGLLLTAIIDSRLSRLPTGVKISRRFGGRFAVGSETEVLIRIENNTPQPLAVILKDEYPPQMKVNGKPFHANGLQDVVVIPKNDGRVVIRNPFDDFSGHYVFHCHILGHEDAGMMQTVDVVRRGQRPTPPPGGGMAHMMVDSIGR